MASELYPPGSPDVLYIVDISSYVLRAYHALVPLSSPSGEPTHAVLGTVNMLELLVRERRPQLLAIAMDAGRDTFRREIYPEYKAHRPPSPPDLSSQIARCEAIVRAYCAAAYKVAGVEADDIIATLVKHARANGMRVVVVASDKDLMQLVGDDVVLWDTMRNRVIGPPEVEERWGVRIGQLGDLLALMGDTSDNIPGVPHVGPKTAKELLVEYGSLEGIFTNVDAIKKKSVRENLSAHKDDAFLSRRLIELKSDCDVPFDRARLRWTGRDVATLRTIYAELGFTKQLSQLDAQGKTETSVPAATTPIPTAADRYGGALSSTIPTVTTAAARVRR